VNPQIDAYFNWPGFFIFAAFAAKVAGVQHLEQVVQWAPVAFNILYLAPLAVILGSSTADRRLMWLGVWFFYTMNWVGQDYFSPQGLTFFLYLAFLAVLLLWFRAPSYWPNSLRREFAHRIGPGGLLGRMRDWLAGWLAPADAPNSHTGPLQRLGLIVMLVAMFTAMVASHQLTPFATLAAVVALSVFNRLALRGLPVLLLVVAVTWIIFMAGAFLSGHIRLITENAGAVSSTLNQNVGSRLSGSSQHLLVVHCALLLTALIFGLGILGAARSLWNGYRDLTYGLLGAAPFTLLALQSYEGEGLLRVYLFALPAIVFFVAALFFTKPSVGRSWGTVVAIVIVSQLMIGGFFLTRYGNERMDYVSAAELSGVQHLYDVAPAGSILLAGSSNLPWRFRGYEQYTYVALDDNGEPTSKLLRDGEVGATVTKVRTMMSNPAYSDAFLIFTRAERAYVEMFGVYPPSTYTRLEQTIGHSRDFQLLYANRDAQIFSLRGLNPASVKAGRGTHGVHA
jgi:hypothetical protein